MGNRNQETIDRLREIADFLEATPGLERFSAMGGLIRHVRDKESFIAQCRSLGAFKKESNGEYISAIRNFGKFDLEIFTGRETLCEPVEVQEHVPAKRIPATEEEIIPARVVTRTEWRCPDSWLGSLETPADV